MKYRINYMAELNAFYDWLETNPLSTSGIVLWHALMHINNKAGWIEEFGVATSVLCIKTGLAERTISKARNELKQKGRIDWRSRKGNRSAMYSMIPLSAPNADKCANKDNVSAYDADSSADNHADKCADSSADTRATLNKLDETKLKELNNSSNARAGEESSSGTIDIRISKVAKFYEQNIGNLFPPASVPKLMDWLEIFDVEPILYAIERAAEGNHRNLKYIEAILKNWKADGLTKIEFIKQHDLEWEEKKKKKKEKREQGQQQDYHSKPSKFVNFKQRDWDFDELERLEREYLIKKLNEG